MGFLNKLGLTFFCRLLLSAIYLILLCTPNVFAGQYIITEIQDEYNDLYRALEILEDPDHIITFEDIKEGRFNDKFFYHSDPTQKLKPFSTYWGKITLNNQAHKDAEWILYPGYKEYIDVYIEQEDGTYELKRAGFFEDLINKDLKKGRDGKVSLFLKYKESKNIYVRVQNISGFRPNFRIRLTTPLQFHEKIEQRNYIQGIFQGLMGILFLYNFLIFILNRDRAYLYYALYLLFSMLYFFSYTGFMRELVLQEGIMVWQSIWIVAIACSPAFYILFMRDFLDTPNLLPKWDKTFKIAPIVMVTSLALQLIYFFISFKVKQVTDIAIYQTLLSYVFMLLCMIRVAATRKPLAYYFLIGSSALWIGIISGTITVLTSDEQNSDFVRWSQAGLAAEALLFSLGLGYRMRKNEQEKRKAQGELIDQLKENEKLQTKVTRELEQKVKERTSEIEQQKEELAAQRDNIEVAYKEISNQNKLIAKKNQDITASITYAKRIQEAILPSVDKIKESFLDAFVLFKPRDIVSGDFYWFTEMENGSSSYQIMAVVDCTGHGVPGAIMSMIGNDLLTEAVKLQKFTQPQYILDYMSTHIKERLQKDQDNVVSDGMDMALCIVDNQNSVLEFAGAKNPLIYIQDGKLHEIKGDKHPIGGYKNKVNSGFSRHQIPLKSKNQNTFYIFSDGYQDQFGGRENRKFMKKQLKKLLLDIHEKPMSEQQKILDRTLQDWMIGHKQLDDILLIGFRV